MSSLLSRLGISVIGPVLILLGFGADQLRAFCSEPARPLLLVALALGRFLMSGAYHFKIKVRSEARAQVLLPLTVISVTLASMYALPWLDAHPESLPALRFDHPAARWGGLILFSAGIGLQAWSTITLGRWFSPRIAIQTDHELIQTGPYAWVRHPFYTGLLAGLLGLPAVFGSWIGLPVAALAAVVVLYRVSVEERLLEDAFGDTFRAQRGRTRKLIPFLY